MSFFWAICRWLLAISPGNPGLDSIPKYVSLLLWKMQHWKSVFFVYFRFPCPYHFTSSPYSLILSCVHLSPMAFNLNHWHVVKYHTWISFKNVKYLKLKDYVSLIPPIIKRNDCMYKPSKYFKTVPLHSLCQLLANCDIWHFHSHVNEALIVLWRDPVLSVNSYKRSTNIRSIVFQKY